MEQAATHPAWFKAKTCALAACASPFIAGPGQKYCGAPCRIQAQNTFTEETREARAQREMWARERNPRRFILYRLRQNAKTRGLECTLTLADIPEIPERCPIFPWVKIEVKVGAGRSPGSPSVDRIDNSKGYVKGNIRIISHRANTLKADATDAELKALGADGAKRAA